MSWPQATQYSAVIQAPSACFSDPELVAGRAVGDRLFGLPLTYSGNFANVYKLLCPDEQVRAVKCFTREAPHRQRRYRAISTHLEANRRKFAVPFKYLAEGIKVNGEWWPVVKMHWVEGVALNEFLRERADHPALLEQLVALWLRLGVELREARMAHGDLQHGNVLLLPGKSTGSLVLRLIDYDGLWAPEIANAPPGEVGHPNYQHPGRTPDGDYGPEMDRFSHLVVYLALRALQLGGKSLWDRYDNGENLLFREADFRHPGSSKLFAELLSHTDEHLRTLAGHLLLACLSPVAQASLTAELVADGKVVSLSPEQSDRVYDLFPAMRLVRRPPPVPPEPLILDALPADLPLLPTPVVAFLPPSVALRPDEAPVDLIPDPPAPPKPRVAALRLPPPPQWFLSVGLSPDGLAARFWPFTVGLVLGLPLLLFVVVSTLALAAPRSSGRPTPSVPVIPMVQVPKPKVRTSETIVEPVPLPSIELTVPPEVALKAGGKTDLLVQLRRVNVKGAVRLVLRDLPENVAADAVEVLADRDWGSLELAAEGPGDRVVRREKVWVEVLLGNQRLGVKALELVMSPSECKIAAPLEPEEVVIPTGDALQLRGAFYPTESPRKSPVVILIHDLSPKANRKAPSWVALAKALQREGCQVLTTDLRGHGEKLKDKVEATDDFWATPANAHARGALAKGKPQRLDAARFSAEYLPFLVQDLIAGRHWLDRRHEVGKANTKNLYVVAAGDGAALAMLWLATEAKRCGEAQLREPAGSRVYEARDLQGAFWINPTLSGKLKEAFAKTNVEATIQAYADWPPMLAGYDKHGEGEEAAFLFALTFGRNRRGPTKGIERGGSPEARDKSWHKAIVEYIAAARRERQFHPWQERDPETMRPVWDLGRESQAASKDGKVRLFPLARLRVSGLRIE